MKKKNLKIRLILIVVSFVIGSLIFSSWADFKAGLLGNPPTANTHDK
jgi:hypothetical protein